ncbi:MAG: hypothetical protein SW833_00905 [Cyanobacteriota bacterium]|nr:hypothetical protein [Cyanobacteriota bacterium]
MEAFNPTPPKWTHDAIHSLQFCCPTCGAQADVAQRVWINRRAPVMSEDYQRKWQEFYHCECETVWWAWSSDRPPSEFKRTEEEEEDSNPF